MLSCEWWERSRRMKKQSKWSKATAWWTKSCQETRFSLPFKEFCLLAAFYCSEAGCSVRACPLCSQQSSRIITRCLNWSASPGGQAASPVIKCHCVQEQARVVFLVIAWSYLKEALSVFTGSLNWFHGGNRFMLSVVLKWWTSSCHTSATWWRNKEETSWLIFTEAAIHVLWISTIPFTFCCSNTSQIWALFDVLQFKRGI